MTVAPPRPAALTSDLLYRVRVAAERCRDLDAAQKLAHAERNRLIVEAVDAGVSQRAVAKATGLTPTRVIRLLSQSQDE